MKTTINQIRENLKEIAQKHLFINEFFWGDLDGVRSYSENELNYPLMLCYYPSGTLLKNQTEIQLIVEVCDKIYKDWNINLNDVESDTLQILRDVFNAIQSPRWKKIARINSASVTKFVGETPDEVAGHRMTLNLLLRDSESVCDSPIIGYDFENNVGNNAFANVINSDLSFDRIVTMGDVLQLPNINVTVQNTISDILSNENIPSVTNHLVTLPDVDNIDSDGSIVSTPNGVPFAATICSNATVDMTYSIYINGVFDQAVTLSTLTNQTINITA